jgi:hypothetical protein
VSTTNKLTLCPMRHAEAKQYIETHHRHSVVPLGMVFALGAAVGESLEGVAIVGRPVARALDDGWTLEVLRLCTPSEDAWKNVCSFLYAASWRATRALGYRRLVTYTRQDEDGTSLLAAHWRIVGEVTARSWHTPTRPRDDRDKRVPRFRWEPAA